MIKPIESYPLFGFVAWGIVIVFALFTLSLAMKLQKIATDLQLVTETLSETTKR